MWDDLGFLRGYEGMVIQFAGVRVLDEYVGSFFDSSFEWLSNQLAYLPHLLRSNTHSYLAIENYLKLPPFT